MKGLQVWSLVRELGSHVPCGQKTKNLTQKQYYNNFNKNLGGKAGLLKCNSHSVIVTLLKYTV